MTTSIARSLTLLLLVALLPPAACRTAPGGSAVLGEAAARYRDAHARSVRLRVALAGVDSDAALRALRPEYLALRETLFDLAVRHASAIVERALGDEHDGILRRVSVALVAGTDLVDNFHALAAALAEPPGRRRVWNEPDPVHDIPAGAWDAALDAYRHSAYHDLFQRAIERLERHHVRVQGWRDHGDADMVALFPDGVEAALAAAARAQTLAAARLGDEDLSADAQALRALVERSRTARAGWAAGGPALAAAIGRDGGAVRGDVHLRVQAVKRELLELREELAGLAFEHAPKVTRDDVPWPRTFRLRAAGLSLLAAVTLWENAAQVQAHVAAIPGVRDLLNQGDPTLGLHRGFWDGVQREFVRPEFRALLTRGIALLEAEQAADVAADPLLAWVSDEILATSATTEARRDRTLKAVALVLRPHARRLDLFDDGGLVKEGSTAVSRAFGNAVGAVELRKGKLFDQPQWAAFLRARLRPGDLLLEKTPFRLTDKLIPGHFGHVALYVGGADDLRALGLARDPRVVPYLGAVAGGRVVVEALRDGTQLNTLEQFLNVDDIAILRPKPGHVPTVDVAQAIALAFSHIGKRYDFSFDTNTWDTIVCSELAFQTYVNVRWPLARVLRAYTIAPDDVAVLAGADDARPFALVAFVHDGRVVHDRAGGLVDETRYAALLGRRYGDAVRR